MLFQLATFCSKECPGLHLIAHATSRGLPRANKENHDAGYMRGSLRERGQLQRAGIRITCQHPTPVGRSPARPGPRRRHRHRQRTPCCFGMATRSHESNLHAAPHGESERSCAFSGSRHVVHGFGRTGGVIGSDAKPEDDPTGGFGGRFSATEK